MTKTQEIARLKRILATLLKEIDDYFLWDTLGEFHDRLVTVLREEEVKED